MSVHSKSKRKHIVFAAAIILIAAAIFLVSTSGYYLTLRNRDTGKIYAEYKLDEGEWFSVEFIHSVNKSPVEDFYQIENKKIFGEECLYYGFGAGVQTQLNPGEKLETTDNGGMLITNIHKDRTNMGYIVGTVSDHVLRLFDKDRNLISEISLRDLCGKNSPVRFNYEFRLIP